MKEEKTKYNKVKPAPDASSEIPAKVVEKVVPPVKEVPKAKFATVNGCNSLNVRRGPSKNDEILRSIASGTKVEVLNLEKDWTRIKIDGIEAYVMSQYLK